MSHTYELCLALGVLSPFVSFWLLVFFGPKLGKPASGWLAVVVGMGIPLALATYVLIGWQGLDPQEAAELTANAFRWHWATLGGVPIEVGVKLDSLTIGMYFMVTSIALCIFVFSVGYMSGHSDEVAGQRKYWRFFAYLSLFAFSMLGLVISSSLLFLFIFWELVGLCSYLLIGFYFSEKTPQYAQMKAFITNRVGDFGFLIGLMLVFTFLGTLDLDEAAAAFAQQAADGTGIFASDFTMFGWGLATIMGVGLFCGAMGKSAQFPLHVWLPDAMAGPTPVSALIHAATMVAAGVYLVARVFRLMTPDALMFISLIGCLTLTLMALIAVVQTDIKKCLAYSTLSQLGYMIFGMGCGAWIAALFHLITHAFFKAMMFLGSGQVIEGCHHEQDMRKMGGLLKKMPVTGFTFLIGVLAIAGTGIAGTHIGIGGFFSKDEILAVAYTRAYNWESDQYEDFVKQYEKADASGEKKAMLARAGGEGPPRTCIDTQFDAKRIYATMPPLPKWMFWAAIFTAYITPFYMMRAWWMTFMGKPRDKHVYDHAHESPMMFLPLVVLAVGTFVSSYFLFRPMLDEAASAATQAPLVLAINGALEIHTVAMHNAHHFLMFGVGFAFLVGFAIAIALYRNGLELAEGIRRLPGVSLIHTLLERKYYIDELYHLLWVQGCMLLAKISAFIDTWIVDMIFVISGWLTRIFASLSGIIDKEGVDGIVNGVADLSKMTGDTLRTPQTGRIRNYVLFSTAVAVVLFACLLIFGLDTGNVASSASSPAADTVSSVAP